MTKGASSLILDLRGNPGGLVKTLEQFAGRLFEKDVKIADMKGRKSSRPSLAKSRRSPFTGRIVAMVDSESASAAEILARVLQIEDCAHDSPLLPAAFAAAHVVALPSHVEVQPLSALQALASGANLVLSDLPGLRRAFGDVTSLTVAICGDITHSRVARSNVALLQMMGARVRLIGPPTLVPGDADRWGCEVFHDMRDGLKGCDVVMMLRLQLERMEGALVPSTREYFRFWGLDREKLAWAGPGAKVMHPGPMNRGVEIDSDVADDLSVSLIQDQVEMGVAARMAVLAALSMRREGGEA